MGYGHNNSALITIDIQYTQSERNIVKTKLVAMPKGMLTKFKKRFSFEHPFLNDKRSYTLFRSYITHPLTHRERKKFLGGYNIASGKIMFGELSRFPTVLHKGSKHPSEAIRSKGAKEPAPASVPDKAHWFGFTCHRSLQLGFPTLVITKESEHLGHIPPEHEQTFEKKILDLFTSELDDHRIIIRDSVGMKKSRP